MQKVLPKEIFRSYASGKLLITGEYFVLEGAEAFACPCQMGQELWIEKVPSIQSQLIWKALDQNSLIWLECKFNLPDLDLMYTHQEAHAAPLKKMLDFILNEKPDLFEKGYSYYITSKLEFDKSFGLGSSSTLIYNLAKWSGIDAQVLLQNTFGGSGYDLACAGAEKPLIYQTDKEKSIWQEIDYHPTFSEQLYFLYLGKKQNSREGIKHFREKVKPTASDIEFVSSLTQAFINANDLKSLKEVINTHEKFISKNLKLPKVKDVYFKDHIGAIKSLGAWGGDFVLMTFEGDKKELYNYIEKKGFEHLYRFNEIIKN